MISRLHLVYILLDKLIYCAINKWYIFQVMLLLFPITMVAQSNTTNCLNSDFSLRNFTNWEGFYGVDGDCGNTYHTGISTHNNSSISHHTIITVNGFDPYTNGGLQIIPPGVSQVAKLGNDGTNCGFEGLSYQLTVDTNVSGLFIYHFAAVLQEPGHPYDEQPKFTVQIFDAYGNVMASSCANFLYVSGTPGMNATCDDDVCWIDWRTIGMSLKQYQGQTIRVVFTTYDCTRGAHFGYAYLYAYCYPRKINLRYCSNNAQAVLTAPSGFNYLWSPGGATTQSVTINNPVNNTVYNCIITSPTNNACVDTLKTFITISPTYNISQNATICSGSSYTLPSGTVVSTPGSYLSHMNTLITGCDSNITVNVNVNPIITPIFNAVAPICSGVTLSALPTTSLNGITGTWSPTLSNTATKTYTFTPLGGQCATNTTMTITVNPNVTPTFNAVSPICSGGTLSALPTTSLNGITGTWSPALNNTATTTYTFTLAIGQCGTSITKSITVNPKITPTFNAVAPICSGATLSALPTTSLNGITGTWAPALNNIATTTYTFTPTVGLCAIPITKTITVNPIIAPTFNAVAPICSGATLSALPTTSLNGITGTWSPALSNTATKTYTFTPSGGQCATNTTMAITVNPNVTPTFNAVSPICSGGTLSALPTTSTNGITGTWSPALNNTTTTTYTFTPTIGQCGTSITKTITVNPNITPTFNAVAPICSGATLSALPTTSLNGITGTWSPALNNIATTTYTFTPSGGQCAISITKTITVNPNITPTFNAVAPICSGATLSALPTTSLNGITGTWSPALSNTATKTYTFTPSGGQCASNSTMAITVNPYITPSFNAVAPICSGATLSALPTTSTNGITGTWSPALNNTTNTTYTFTPTIGQCGTSITKTITVNPNITPTFNAVSPICSGATLSALPTTSLNGITGTWAPALNNIATTIYTFTPSGGQCAISITKTITVNPNITPTFNTVAPICSGATLSALPTTSLNGITGTWSPALNNIATTTYTFTPSGGQCATSTTLTITVNQIITPIFTPLGPYCVGAIPAIFTTTSTNGITGVWNPTSISTATLGSTTYTFTPSAGQCATNKNISIIVNPNPNPSNIYHLN